jgi:hypothetical protein
MKKVLITGSLGHIGSGLLKYLEKYSRNLELVITDNLLTQRFSSLFNLPTNVVSFHQIDTRDSVIEKLVEVPVVRVDTIYVATKQFATAKQPNVMNEIGTLKKEIQETKDLLILSMLKKESPSDRIQAVNYSYDLQQPDEQVLKALIYTLDYDRNVNVRIAAADAIGRFGNNTNVRDALVKSLLKQQEPTLQISIIDILTKYNERKALPALRLLAEDNSTSEFVRQKAEESTRVLSL